MAKKNNPNNPMNDDEVNSLAEQMSNLLPGTLDDKDESSMTVEAKEADEEGNELKPMDDLEVLAILNYHENSARSFVQDEISTRAAQSNEYYLAQPRGFFAPPETSGRSSYVDSAVADTINWLLPPLLETFAGTDDVVEFTAKHPSQEKSADMTSAMVNHVWKVLNPHFSICDTWFKDALMTPGGILKVYWQPDTTKKTTMYRGLTDLQFNLIAQDPSIQVVKHTIRPNPDFNELSLIQHSMAVANGITPPATQQIQGQAQGQVPLQAMQIDPTLPEISKNLHDIALVHNTDEDDNNKGQIKIYNVPLEEFYVDPYAKRIEDANYAAHAVRKPISDLRAMGFDDEILDEVSNTQWDPEMSLTYLARTEIQGSFANGYHNEAIDPSMREIIIVEAYIKMDYFQTGEAEWRKITRCGNVILENLPTDGNPFIILSSNPLPHLLFGVSVAEQAQNAQWNNTELYRALIDNINLSANAQMSVVVDQANMDDLLDTKPGGIVRVKQQGAVQVLQQGSGDVSSVVELLGLLDTARQERTGVMKLTQGSDADILNQTASGNAAMTDRSNQRIKMMARNFAENGFRPLALRIQKLLAMYQNEMMQVRINGQIQEADPQDAANQYDVSVTVGLGTGDKTKQTAALGQILTLQQAAIQQGTGMCNLELVHNTVEKLVKSLGFTNPGDFFCAPTSAMPLTQPPQASPDVTARAQADIQVAQFKAQNDSAQQQRQAQIDAMRIAAQAKSDNEQAALDYQREMAKLQVEQQMQLEELHLKYAIQRETAALQAKANPMQEGAMFDETYNSTNLDDDFINSLVSNQNKH